MVGRNNIYLLFIVLAFIYISVSLSIPPDAEVLTRYGLSPERARLLKLSVLVPYIAIWFAAFFRFAQLRKYADTISGSAEGKSFATITDGLMILAISMPITGITNTISNYYATTHPGTRMAGTIIINYLDITLAAFALIYLYRGSRRLSSTISNQVNSAYDSLFRSSFLILAGVYSYLMLTNPARQFPTEEVSRAAYYLPDFLLMTTVIIPSMLVWYFGFLAANHIYTYSKNVSGNLYRKSLSYLAAGVLFIIFAKIALRFFGSLTTLFATSSLRFLLIIIYALLIVIASGYVTVAIGARKLKKIEEV